MGVVPIVNENDSISVSELKFGDNDTLSAITAGLVNADFLFLLTDVDCLYTDNPRTNPDAKPVLVVDDLAKLKEQVSVSSPGSALGTGGMVTKLVAAELATSIGVQMIITHGAHPERIPAILDYIHGSQSERPPFTLFTASKNAALSDRKWWILHSLPKTHGKLFIDFGATRAITAHKSSLFAAGIVRVDGRFERDQAVQVMTELCDGSIVEIGKGLVNYSSTETSLLKGERSDRIVDILGYGDSDYIIHRDNLAITLRDGPWDQIRWKGKQ